MHRNMLFKDNAVLMTDVVPYNDNTRRELRNSDTNDVKFDDAVWTRQLSHKLRCLRNKYGSIYLYHMRKCAG